MNTRYVSLMYSPGNNLLHLEQTLLHLELLLHEFVYRLITQVPTSTLVHVTHCSLYSYVYKTYTVSYHHTHRYIDMQQRRIPSIM